MYKRLMSALSGGEDPEGEELSSELREVFEKTDDPALSAVEVAAELEISQQAAHRKLMYQHQAGNVARKKVGARAVVWWLED